MFWLSQFLLVVGGVHTVVPFGFNSESQIWYETNFEKQQIYLAQWDMVLPFELDFDEDNAATGQILLNDLFGSGIMPYMIRTYLINYSFFAYPIHQDRIDQIRGQRTTGVAERGNRDKRICFTNK